MNILVLAAHPDDEVLGCGGTIARLAAEGHEVFIAILGEGITSRFSQQSEKSDALVQALHNHSKQVAQLLGAREVVMGGFPDNRFDSPARCTKVH